MKWGKMGLVSKKLNNIGLIILVFFMVYDTARNYTHLPSVLGYTKDIIIYWWLIELVYMKAFKLPFRSLGFYIVLSMCVIWSWVGLFYPVEGYDAHVSPLIYILKQSEFFILLFVFRNYNRFFSRSYDKYIKLYLYLSVLLFFVTLIGVYVDNNIISKNIISENGASYPEYANRISIGQPAIATFSQVISLFFLLLCVPKTLPNLIMSLICLLGVFMSTSITGIMSVICLLTVIAVSSFIVGKTSAKIKIFALVVGLVLAFSYFIQTDYFYNNFGIAYLMVETRIDQFLYGTSVDPSMEMRVAQQEYVINALSNSLLGSFWGQGCNGAVIENSYYGVLLRFGLVGTVGFCMFFFSLIKKSIQVKSMFLIAFVGIYLAHWYTLDVLYVPQLSYAFSFFWMYCLYHNDGQCKSNSSNV